MTPQERIQYIITTCAAGSLKTFSEQVGINVTVASRLRSGKLGNSEREGLGRFAERIYRAYPELDAGWLLTGEGSPLKMASASGLEDRLRRMETRIDALEKEKKVKI